MKKQNPTIIFLFLLMNLIGSEIIYATEFVSAKDSLELDLLTKLGKTKKGDKARLQIYEDLSKTAKSTESEVCRINEMLAEAKSQKNNEYICKAYMAHLILAYNTYDVEGVNKWYRLLEPIARKEKMYDIMFRGRQGIIDMHNVTGDYEREEKEALEMLNEARELNSNVGMIAAYQSLSHAYRATFRINEAAEILEKGYYIAYRTNDKGAVLELNNLLIGTYQSLKDQENILKWTKRLDSFLTKIVRENPSLKTEYKGGFLLTYLAYLSYYANEKDQKNAEIYLKLAEKYQIGYGVYENYYHVSRLNYFKKMKIFDQALIEVDKMINLYKELSPVSHVNMNFEKAYILEQMGQIDDALALYNHSFFMIDSIYVSTLNKQTEQIKSYYDTDQLLIEKEKIRSNIHAVFFCLVALIIIIIICFVINAYRVRYGLEKSANEMRRMAEEMEKASATKELFLSNISTAISVPLNFVVDGSLRLATDDIVDIEERKNLSLAINATSSQLLATINNILNLSRLEAGMMRVKLVDLDILQVLQGVVMMKKIKGIDINLVLSNVETELKVNADLGHLQEVFNNLFTYSKSPITISISVLEAGTKAQIDIQGSSLTTEKIDSQEIVIINETNRLMIALFGGEYTIKSCTDISTPIIQILLPIV